MSADTFGALAQDVYMSRYSLEGQEDWPQTAARVSRNVMAALGYDEYSLETLKVRQYITERKFMPGGRYLASTGREYHQTQNCYLFRAEDSVEGWGDLLNKVAVTLMRGGGVGVDYSAIRARGSKVKTTGHKAGGPCALMKAVNEVGRQMKEGERLAALWAGLNWDHPDIFEFLEIKDWSPELREFKAENPLHPMQMEYTNVSVLLDDEFFSAYKDSNHPKHFKAQQVYWTAVKKMLTTAEPGFSVNLGANANETLRNACTEVTSADDSDVCNLGSLNLGKIKTLGEFSEIVKYATLFLLAGSVYSDLPYQKVEAVRTKNRRLGLGLMGVHEWLLKRGKPYAPDTTLAEWMEVYSWSTIYAHQYADKHNLTRPVKTRAIAPAGTISMVAETTSGMEPVFCVAQKRRWKDGEEWVETYAVDPTAQRLIESGVEPDSIEDAYSISFADRLKMQAWLQRYVDHGISSTVNIRQPIRSAEKQKEYGNILMEWLPHLRGVTVYPDGARTGQPLTPVKYEEAVNPEVYEDEFKCSGSVCSI